MWCPRSRCERRCRPARHLLRGDVHLRIGDRLKDELDRPGQFLAVTDARSCAADGQVLFRAPFLAVSRAHIVWVMPASREAEQATP